MRRRGAALLLIAGVIVSGCTSAPDALAQQYREGTTQNYISGDGALTIIAPDSRAEPVVFGGELETGGQFSSAEHAGEVMVVNFWYAGCPPCRLEARDLEALHQQFRDEGVVFVGVNIMDQAPTALTFASEFEVTYPSILDVKTGGVRLAFSGQVAPNAVPTTLVLDRQARVAGRISGLLTDPNVLASIIDDVAAEAR